MPLYNCLLQLLAVSEAEGAERSLRGLIYHRNGVLTDIKSFGTIYLGYGIKKLNGHHYQGQLLQMTMMVPPTVNKDLQYLNKEDRLLRWLVVKHRNSVYGLQFINEDEGKDQLNMFRSGSLFKKGNTEDDDFDDGDGDEEYDIE